MDRTDLEDDEVEYHRAIGRIDRLEVENFKSYKGHQQIGPFKNFTAIIGPNGSGKSNVMDAISFVLGVRTNQLRGSLRELLYSSSAEDPLHQHHQQQHGTDSRQARKGYVKLVYVTDAEEEVHFTRVIQPSSSEATGATTYSSVYKINDRVVTWDAYSKRLASYGILVKVRNFLVFQVGQTFPQGFVHMCEGLQWRGRGWWATSVAGPGTGSCAQLLSLKLCYQW